MRTPNSLHDPNSVEAIIKALRGPQGPQFAGDIVPLDFSAHGGSWSRAGPAASGPAEMLRMLQNPAVDRSNLGVLPPEVWRGYMARQPAPPVYLPPPPSPIGPPGSGGAGGNLWPKL